MTTAVRRIWAIVPAAGRGERFAATAAIPGTVSAGSGLPKQYMPLLGKTVLEWSLQPLLTDPRIHAVVVALAAQDANWAAVADKLGSPKLLTTTGGAHRHESVARGLEFLASLAAPDDWVLVHDAARPCLSRADLKALIDALEPADMKGAARQGAVLAAPVADTVKRQAEDSVATVNREGLWRALTPQVFKFGDLQRALAAATAAGFSVTDESQAVERIGLFATLVPGSVFNIKVTRAEDLTTAAQILSMMEGNRMRVGQGIDVHSYGEGDHVVLGGVRIAHTQGIVAHSDGDVVIHALCDALLGAMGDGDIGQHFPDTDARYRGVDSRVLLRVVAQRMRAAGLHLVNADITVLAEAPRIAAHRGAMAANLAEDLGCAANLINVKATTTEKLGFVGRKEGLAAMASALLAS